MEHVVKETGTTKGVEVLFFEEAEIKKMKGDKAFFAASGPLSVLYFKDYNRFVLKLNDWRYPLMSRLPIIASGKDEYQYRGYTLPALNGFSYDLRISKSDSTVAIDNFETILAHNSDFSLAPLKKRDASPDDRITREHPHKDTGLTEVITQAFHSATDLVKNMAKSFTTGKTVAPTKAAATDKLKSMKTDIKTKNFKKEAHSTLKKEFFEAQAKATQDFLARRKENPNLTQECEIDDLRKTSDAQAPVFFIPNEEIEDAILINKDLIKQTIKI